MVVFCLLCSFAVAQTSKPVAPAVNDDFVHQQFGNTCSLVPGFAPMTADLNGDGIEDVVLVARCKNPLIDQDEKNFRVIDPMDSFYGYGNTKITTAFGQDDPRLRGLAVLIIHGIGAEAWHSAQPGPKFVVINVAVKTITVKKLKVGRKKIAEGIYVEEATGDQMTSAIYWDGKKYRYEPLGSAME
jgi:hypothetical protein